MKTSLLILAAGIGSRYGGLKQIDPVGPRGEKILDYSIFDALRAGFGKIVFVIRPDFEEMFKKEIGNKFTPFCDVAYCYQTLDALPAPFQCPPARIKPWGTAHAIMVSEKVIEEPFAVINADDFYGRESFQLMNQYLQSIPQSFPDDYAMVGYILRNTLSDHGSVSRGVCESDEQSFLRKIVEIVNIERYDDKAGYTAPDGSRKLLSGAEIVSMNLWGFTSSFYAHLRRHFVLFLEKNVNNIKAEYFITEVIDTLIKTGQARIKVLETESRWFGVTYKEDRENVIRSVRKLVDRGEYPENLMEGLCRIKDSR